MIQTDVSAALHLESQSHLLQRVNKVKAKFSGFKQFGSVWFKSLYEQVNIINE